MPYRQDIEACFDGRIKGGIGRQQFEAALDKLSPALAELKARKNAGAAALMALPAKTDDIAGLETLGKEIRQRYAHIVVVGSGGSGLSGRTLNALRSPYVKPEMHFIDNMDPDALGDILASDIITNAFFIVISKSGATVETLGQFYVLFEHVKAKLGAKAAERFLLIAMPGDNPLRQAASDHGLKILDHASDIGGRFSVMTNVGLLPAAAAGIDIKAIRRGAQSVVKALDAAAAPDAVQPAIGAALQYACMEKGFNISIIMPYGERLFGLNRWYRQGWAESLGKHGKGSTAACAMGTTDQHSQLQLYLDGPRDKLINLITAKRTGSGQKVPAPGHDGMAYIRGKSTGDIMAAEQKATLETFIRNNVPVRHFQLEKIDEEALGALLMHFTLEIVFMSYLLNVNPFDQPAVEEGKHLARDYLLSNNL